MNNIEQIILSVLEANSSRCLDNHDERQLVANKVANVLISQSLEQLANLLGGSVEVDNNGQAVIYTGINCHNTLEVF